MFNKKVKKMVALLAVTAMAGSLLAGCGSSDSSSSSSSDTSTGTADTSSDDSASDEGYSGQLVISIHDQLDNATIGEAIEYLQTTEKWENVEFVIADADVDYEENMPIQVMSGETIDVVYTFNPIYHALWADAGIILDIEDELVELGIDLDEKYGNYADAARVDGVTYGIPGGATSWALFYNMSIFDDAGIEYPDQYEAMTWTEYRELAAELTSGSGADKVYGTLHLDWVMYWYGEAIMNLGGGEYFYDEDGLSNIEDPAFADALEDTYNMQNVDGSTPKYSEIVSSQIEPDAWLSGGYAMYLHGTWMLNWLADTDTYPRDFEVGFAPMPVPDDSEEGTLMTWGVCACYAVAATTSNSVMATDFCIDIVEYATANSSSDIYADQTIETENLYVSICDEIDDEMFTTEALYDLFLNEDIVMVTEKVSGTNCAYYEAIITEEVTMYLAEAQDLETTIANIKERGDAVILDE